MEIEKEKQEKKFIQERLVPKKNLKKPIEVILSTIGLAILFGSVAGVVFFISQNVMGKDPDTVPTQIVIARDDTTAAETEESTEEETEPETEETVEETIEESVPETEPVVVPEPIVISQADVLKEVNSTVSKSLVTINVINTTDGNLFESSVTENSETFGVVVAESSDSYYILFDDDRLTEDSVILINYGSDSVRGTLQGTDTISGLSVCRVIKKVLSKAPKVIALGNSFLTRTADEVYLFGAPYGKPGAMEYGIVTYSGESFHVTDGYEQYLYTDMERTADGRAILVNEDCQLLGWISDYSAGDENLAIACGISPLKYIIEDLCSGRDTAYLGITAVSISEEEAVIRGTQEGIYIQSLVEDSPAFYSGLQIGDRILSFNDEEIEDIHHLQQAIDGVEAGTVVSIIVERLTPDGSDSLTFSVELGSR